MDIEIYKTILKKDFVSLSNLALKELSVIGVKNPERLINWCYQCLGIYYYQLGYLKQFNILNDDKIKKLCNEIDKKIIAYVKQKYELLHNIDDYTKKMFERDYRIANIFSHGSFNNYQNDWTSLDYDAFATNGFWYYIKAFKELKHDNGLNIIEKEEQINQNMDKLRNVIIDYTRNYYKTQANPWFPDHLSWWPKEFWWNDVLAYGAVVFRDKKFEDVVLYPENLEKVEILKLGR